jgi:hypothetical protein
VVDAAAGAAAGASAALLMPDSSVAVIMASAASAAATSATRADTRPALPRPCPANVVVLPRYFGDQRSDTGMVTAGHAQFTHSLDVTSPTPVTAR